MTAASHSTLHDRGGPELGWLQSLATELPITLTDWTVWLSIGQGLLIGAVCLLCGIWVARYVGLLPFDAPAGEILGVGLGSGLLVLTSWWAAVASGGRSSFTPVAVGFAIAIGLAFVRHDASSPSETQGHPISSLLQPFRTPDQRAAARTSSWRSSARLSSSLRWGSSMARRWRPGLATESQPLEFMDEAFYSIIGRTSQRPGPRPSIRRQVSRTSRASRRRTGITGANYGLRQP